MFNPMTEVPRNDEEVEIALLHGRDELLGNTLVGLYRAHRGQGKSVLEAFEAVLLAHVRAFTEDTHE